MLQSVQSPLQQAFCTWIYPCCKIEPLSTLRCTVTKTIAIHFTKTMWAKLWWLKIVGWLQYDKCKIMVVDNLSLKSTSYHYVKGFRPLIIKNRTFLRFSTYQNAWTDCKTSTRCLVNWYWILTLCLCQNMHTTVRTRNWSKGVSCRMEATKKSMSKLQTINHVNPCHKFKVRHLKMCISQCSNCSELRARKVHRPLKLIPELRELENSQIV